MSLINGHSAPYAAKRGFSLLELMIVMSLSSIIFAGVFSAYIFLARNLERIANLQKQDKHNRTLAYLCSQDVSAASQINTASSSQLVFTVIKASGTSTVTYAYNAGSGTLTRTDASGTKTMLTDLTSFGFNYYNKFGAATSTLIAIKQIDLSYTSATGNASNETQSSSTFVFPRLLLRNKPLLQ